MIQGKFRARGRRATFSRLADVAMATPPGRAVIMAWLIQIWQAPITHTSHHPLSGRESKKDGGCCGEAKTFGVGGGEAGQGEVRVAVLLLNVSWSLLTCHFEHTLSLWQQKEV